MSGQALCTDGVKLFCCLYAMMDKGLCSVFAVCLAFFLSHSGHISLLYGRVVAVFSWHHITGCLSTVAPVCPAPLNQVIHTFKKRKKEKKRKQSSAGSIRQPLVPPRQSLVCQCAFISQIHYRISQSCGFYMLLLSGAKKCNLDNNKLWLVLWTLRSKLFA